MPVLTPLYASSCKRLHWREAALLSALRASSWDFAACLGGIFQYTLSLKDASMLAGPAANIQISWFGLFHPVTGVYRGQDSTELMMGRCTCTLMGLG